jgi:hypothetical protein
VVVTVSVVCTAAPFTVTLADEHAGAGLALVAMTQLRVTVPLKLPDGVTVVVKVAELPAATVAEAGLGVDSEKLPPPAVTVSVTVAGELSDPDVPVTVMG